MEKSQEASLQRYKLLHTKLYNIMFAEVAIGHKKAHNMKQALIIDNNRLSVSLQQSQMFNCHQSPSLVLGVQILVIEESHLTCGLVWYIDW